MEEFRSGGSRVLIATDVWGRGLDVQQVPASHLILTQICTHTAIHLNIYVLCLW